MTTGNASRMSRAAVRRAWIAGTKALRAKLCADGLPPAHGWIDPETYDFYGSEHEVGARAFVKALFAASKSKRRKAVRR